MIQRAAFSMYNLSSSTSTGGGGKKRKQLATKKQLEEIGKKWEPYRSVGTWYLWKFDSEGLKKKET